MDIEARYLDVEWDSERNVLGVKYGEPIEIFQVIDSQYEIETVTFKKTYFYFALRVTSEKLKYIPFFFFKDKKEELLEVKDPRNGQTWWIAKGEWIKPKNSNKWKYSHEIWRTAGRVKLKIQDKLINIDNRTNSFSLEELEYILKDFKDELWNIILKTDSVITGNINKGVEKKVPNIFNDEVVHLIDRFIKSAQNILIEPKYILKETQGLQPLKKVRPIMRTFRELSTRPESKYLTSRIHIASLNTAENKYVHYCVDKLYTLFNKLQEAAKVNSFKIQEKANDYKEEAEELQRKLNNPKEINKNVFEKELQEVKLRYIYIEKGFSKLLSLIEKNNSDFSEEFDIFKRKNKYLFALDTCNESYETRSFSIDSAMSGYKNTFFCNYLEGCDFKKHPKYENDYQGKYLCVEYPSFIAEFLKNHANKDKAFSFTGIFNWEELNGGFKFTCLKIFDIKEYKVDHILTLGPRIHRSETDFFCNAIDGCDYKKTQQENDSVRAKYLRSRFPSDIFNFLVDLAGNSLSVRIVGTANFKFESDYEVVIWSNISRIELIYHPLQDKVKKYEEIKDKYEKNGWIDQYTDKERNEIISESKYLLNRSEDLSGKLKKFIPITNSLKFQLQKIRKIKIEFKSLGVDISSVFPNSMTFVQNPSYSGLHSSFKLILLKSNLSLSQLEKMMIIERIGLVNVATLYERWVLLLIIKILSNDFGFVFEEDWENKLIDAVGPNKNNSGAETEFTAVMPNRQIKLELSYDKKLLSSRRRPDYILDIKYKDYERTEDSGWSYKREALKSKLVMDAKFHDDSNESEIISTIKELAIEKNYRERKNINSSQEENLPIESDNRLFIIHPIKNIISKSNRTSPLEWGALADYGHVGPNHSSGLDEDTYKSTEISLTKHKLGHVCVVPSKNRNEAADNLKRLILLHLQSTVSILFKQEIKPGQQPDWHNCFCPECNASELDLKLKANKTQGGGTKWTINCKLCSFNFEENFCYNCKARLFKNGLKWTYHRTYAQMVTNCRCPNCNSDLFGLSK